MWKISKSFSEEKEKQRQYGPDWYKNVPEDWKRDLVEYRKNIKESEKTLHCNYKKPF